MSTDIDLSWRKSYVEERAKRIEKYYKEYDIDNLLNEKQQLEEMHGKELGYQMFKGFINQIMLKDTIKKAELKIKYEGGIIMDKYEKLQEELLSLSNKFKDLKVTKELEGIKTIAIDGLASAIGSLIILKLEEETQEKEMKLKEKFMKEGDS